VVLGVCGDQGAPHLACVGPALLLSEREGTIDHVRDGRRNGVSDLTEALRRLGGRPHDDLARVLRVVDEPPCEEGEHRRTERPEVGPSVDLSPPAERLLRCHERRRPDGTTRARRRCGIVRLEEPRDAEVEDPNLAIGGDEDVPGLDVPVNDLLRVRDLQRV
jgi:hypothetical protein